MEVKVTMRNVQDIENLTAAVDSLSDIEWNRVVLIGDVLEVECEAQNRGKVVSFLNRRLKGNIDPF